MLKYCISKQREKCPQQEEFNEPASSEIKIDKGLPNTKQVQTGPVHCIKDIQTEVLLVDTKLFVKFSQ